MTVEKILEEKKTFDLSVQFERHGLEDEDKRWSVPGMTFSSFVLPGIMWRRLFTTILGSSSRESLIDDLPIHGRAIKQCRTLENYISRLTEYRSVAPSTPTVIPTLPTSSNILHVSIERYQDVSTDSFAQHIIATTADRRLHRLKAEAPFELLESKSHTNESPILSCSVLTDNYLLSTSMSGQLLLLDLEKGVALEERRDHQKYVVKVATLEDEEGFWVATAGWDAKVFVYRLRLSPEHTSPSLGPPVATLAIPTNPEDVLFVQHPDAEEPVLIVSRRDSTSLYYYSLPTKPVPESISDVTNTLQLLGTQNLAPHSNAWISFSPSCLALCPKDPALLAVATSAVPHMKLIIVRLLCPSPSEASGAAAAPANQAEQTQATLATQDREDVAIVSNTSTLAPQTPYSTPQVCWRPDGTGVWVNGDDGVLRGVEAKTGKIMATLRGGHVVGSKIRTIWCGWVHVNGRREERLVSGGFDRRLIVWEAVDQTDRNASV